ncbi:MAG: rhodanese-like domain-containing protein [Verrucomicrobiota bacterium]
MKTLLTTLAVAVVATMGTAVAGEYADISLTELKDAIGKKEVVVLDVNGTTTYAKNHIPSAIDFRANKDKLAEMLPENKETLIVAYCGGPSCSAYKAAADAAKGLGYTNVKHFSGGIKGWLDAGEETHHAQKQ